MNLFIFGSSFCRLEKKGPSLSKQGRELLRTLYKAHQTFHLEASELGFYLVPVFLASACSILITSAFCLFQFRSVLNPPLIFLIALLGGATFIIFKMVLELAAHITHLSCNFKAAFAKNAEIGKGDFRFLRASPILMWKVGGIFVLEPRTFFVVLNNVVVSMLVNLLISF